MIIVMSYLNVGLFSILDVPWECQTKPNNFIYLCMYIKTVNEHTKQPIYYEATGASLTLWVPKTSLCNEDLVEIVPRLLHSF